MNFKIIKIKKITYLIKNLNIQFNYINMLLTKLFNFVLSTSKLYNIDESHSLGHSMNVLNFANNIIDSEIEKNPYLNNHKNIIYTSSIVHDMCDKKYIDEKEGIERIKSLLYHDISLHELDIISKIIMTMSYSKVKVNGFPNLGEYQLAYNIVRESDLLSSYDFDRCMIYKMYVNNYTISEAYMDAINLFENRVFKYNDDKMLLLDYSKNISKMLEENSKLRINNWKNILL
jgi:hypothetical protein